MSHWYLSYEGQQMGPLDHSQAVAQARRKRNGFAWREGFAEWLPISQVGELSESPMAGIAPPPPTSRTSDEIDFRIIGSEMQFVEIELDPGESAVAEAGAMMYKDSAVEMETVFGDASQGGGNMLCSIISNNDDALSWL